MSFRAENIEKLFKDDTKRIVAAIKTACKRRMKRWSLAIYLKNTK